MHLYFRVCLSYTINTSYTRKSRIHQLGHLEQTSKPRLQQSIQKFFEMLKVSLIDLQIIAKKYGNYFKKISANPNTEHNLQGPGGITSYTFQGVYLPTVIMQFIQSRGSGCSCQFITKCAMLRTSIYLTFSKGVCIWQPAACGYVL